MLKVLVIRFSSIGDIVLTSPVFRALKEQQNARVHFVCKAGFAGILSANPHIDKIWPWKDEEKKTLLAALAAEKFDLIVDLHKNLRSANIRRTLKIKTLSFDKINLEKWLIVNFKWNRLPDLHLVDRYFEALRSINITNDHKGLDYFIPAATKPIRQLLPENFEQKKFICLAIGAAHPTKQIPMDKLDEICRAIELPILLLGGKNDLELANQLMAKTKATIHSIVGKTSLHESARCIESSLALITPDTGMMHIGAALKKPIVAVWGNTIPEFGMEPYYPKGMNRHQNIFVAGLNCRPCSKIGKQQCPKRHFDCMKKISVSAIQLALNALIVD